MKKYLDKIKKDKEYIFQVSNQVLSVQEDDVVASFLGKMGNNKKYLEVGSGMAEFAKKIKEQLNFEVTCIEINKKLVERSSKPGIETVNKDFRKNDFLDNFFDVTHCSHLIEHFSYPDVSIILDELFRVTKTGGTVIIRSPFMNDNFYHDIDHVRPYPPNSILNYFNKKQQQKNSLYLAEVEKIHLRKPFKIIKGSSVLTDKINIHLMQLWQKYKFPKAKATAYTMFLKKIK